MDDAVPLLKEAADYYYDAAELWEDDSISSQDHVAILRAAFSSSDCDDFAYVLNLMTGWQTVRATWQIPDWGFGHHTLVRSPEGRLLDVNGWTDEGKLSKRYGGKKGVTITLTDVDPSLENDIGELDEDGSSTHLNRIVNVIRNLPLHPYNQDEFRMLLRDLPDVDFSDNSKKHGQIR